MIPRIEILGSGNAGQVPVWGCDCAACNRAQLNSAYRRRPCSISITTEQGVTLIDAGRVDLAERYQCTDIRRFVLTHFHMDHVQGLFHLRWANRATKIPVFIPDDPKGADDLYKHPGCFEFQAPWQAFVEYDLGDMKITVLPLIHSKPCFGYLLDLAGRKIAYLTDTVGLPDATAEFLRHSTIDYCILDCSEPPRTSSPRNHNDLNLALAIVKDIQPAQTLLTHIGHQFDCWLMAHAEQLPDGVSVVMDHQQIVLG